MLIETTNKLFEIQIEELSQWEKRPHKHNFFEIIYVEKGCGMQCINQHKFEYTEGNIFLLPPLDCHTFEIKEPSRFYFIRFTDHYFLKNDGLTDYKDWFDRIAYIIANYNRIPGDIIDSDRERQFIINNVKSIYQEYLASDNYSEPIITGAIASILNVLARSIEKKYVDKANEVDSRFGEVLRFINTNISDNNKLRVPFLAEHFSLSKSYFSEYFKKQAGVSLADYILKSKLRLVETKVLHTDLSLKEIAYQIRKRKFKQATPLQILEEEKYLLENLKFKTFYWGDHGNNIVSLKGFLPQNQKSFLDLVNEAITSHPAIKEEILQTYPW